MKKLYSIMLSRSCLVGIMIWFGWFVVLPTHAQVSGFVYRDFNADGVRTDTLPIELGMTNITVRLFLDRATQPISTTTGSDGRYSFSAAQVPAGSAFRLEFTNLPTGFFATPHGTDNRTTVQIGVAPAIGMSVAINYPADYCESIPTLVTPCYVNGDPLKTTYDDGRPIPPGQQAATGDVLVAYPYTATGVAGKTGLMPTHLAFGAETGALWGVAYQRRSNILLSAAVIKRHTGLGPLGTGGIYQTDMATFQTRPYLDVQTLGINTGANPHSGLLGDKLMANYDSVAMNAVGRVGIGGITISEDDKVLYFVNLYDKKVYGITLNVPARNFIGSPITPTAADTISWKIPDPGCVRGGFRPWAIQYYRGNIYVGGVCSAENADPKLPYADTSALRAVIYKFNPAQGRNAQLTEVLSFPLSYTRGYADGTDSCANFKYWLPWTNMFPKSCNNNKHVMWPQPVLSDVVFDVDGSMGIGMLDRFGFLSGRHNFAPTQNDNAKLYDGFSSGDMLRAYNNNGTYRLERNGLAGPLLGSGVNSGQGPGGGEFYGDDYWLISSNGNLFVGHDEIFNGGLVLVPGKGEILTTAYDPLTDVYQSGGIRAVFNRNGRSNRGYVLYADEPGTFGKASGLGDLAIVCGVSPFELGNLIWFDDNRNGIQDPYEKGIPNITLTLHDMENGGVQVGQTITSSTGEYYFNNSNVTPKLLPNHRYQIRLNPQQLAAFTPASGRRAAALASQNFYLSLANQIDAVSGSNQINSKGVVFDDYFVINIITTDVGESNHQLDLSVYACPNLSTGSDTVVACAGTTISSLVINGRNFARDDSVRIVYFDTPQSGTAMYGSGGAVLGTYKPVNGQIVVNNPNLPAAVGGEKVYYIYAIIHPPIPDPNCRPYTSMVAVIKPKPIATITAGALSCLSATAQLSVSLAYANGTPVTNGTYYWAGPNGFTSTSANPVVTTEGTYTVAVSTGICNAFPGQNFSTVVVNRVPESPVSVSIVEAFGTSLSCSTCVGSLSAVVAPATATVLWTGPNNFTSSQLNPNVDREGSYTLVATNTNGCRTVRDVAVVQVYTKTISVTASSICIKDTPYISYTIAAQHFVPPTNGATITVTKYVGGDTVLVMRNQPLSGTFLYPGAAVDSNGDPTDWPGWRFENGEWIQEDDGLRPRVVVHISINPTTEAVVFYPDPSPLCIGGPPMGLGDFVWKDFNKNGIQEAGEPGVPNVRVELYTVTNGQRSASPVSTTVTDSAGKYLFDRLGNGDYQVRFVPATFPTGCTLTVANQGDDKLDSDADANGYSQIVTLSLTDPVSPRPNRTIDAGLVFVPVMATVCAGQPATLTLATGNQPQAVRFLASKIPLSLTDVCAGVGLNLGTATAGANGLISLATSSLTATTGTDQRWYIYVTSTANVSAGTTCLPVGEIQVVATPVPQIPVILEAYGGALPCVACPVTLEVVTDPADASVLWRGPNSFTSTLHTPEVTRAGFYTVVASAKVGVCTVVSEQVEVEVLPIIDDPCPVVIMSDDQTICSGNSATAITANTFNVSFGSQIRYIMFDTPQVDPAVIYGSTSGTVIALAAPDDLGTVSLTSTNGIFVNNGTTPVAKYIYATVYPEPADISCRPYDFIQVNVLPAISPSLTVTARPATCSGPMALANGSIVINGFSAGDRYSIAAQPSGLAASYTAANLIPSNGIVANQLNNPVSPLTYYVRVLNASNCYQDYTVILTPTNCVCPTPVCVPMVIRRIR
ncbi:SdrD B-like domain-containing protein [Arsenicibacter rosenii]|nr:SdrD B-like domain-containing protein [Arsenicibacter rosenii]